MSLACRNLYDRQHTSAKYSIPAVPGPFSTHRVPGTSYAVLEGPTTYELRTSYSVYTCLQTYDIRAYAPTTIPRTFLLQLQPLRHKDPRHYNDPTTALRYPTNGSTNLRSTTYEPTPYGPY